MADSWPLESQISAVVFRHVVLNNFSILCLCKLRQKKESRVLTWARLELVELCNVTEDIDSSKNLAEVFIRDHMLSFICLCQL